MLTSHLSNPNVPSNPKWNPFEITREFTIHSSCHGLYTKLSLNYSFVKFKFRMSFRKVRENNQYLISINIKSRNISISISIGIQSCLLMRYRSVELINGHFLTWNEFFIKMSIISYTIYIQIQANLFEVRYSLKKKKADMQKEKKKKRNLQKMEAFHGWI